MTELMIHVVSYIPLAVAMVMSYRTSMEATNYRPLAVMFSGTIGLIVSYLHPASLEAADRLIASL